MVFNTFSTDDGRVCQKVKLFRILYHQTGLMVEYAKKLNFVG